MRIALYIWFLTFAFTGNFAFPAVEIETGVHPVLKMPGVRLMINGDISPDDIAPIRKILDEVKKSGKATAVEVWLDSPGGAVLAALQIGRLIRVAKASTEVRGKCASACVFILAAGIQRSAAPNTVGIHRPTFTTLDKNLSYVEVRKRLEKLDIEVARFMKDMDVPNSLLEAMKSTPPEQMRWLNQNELQEYRLIGTDPAAQELHEAAMADHFKISKREYQRRVAVSARICAPMNEFGLYMECHLRVLETGQ